MLVLHSLMALEHGVVIVYGHTTTVMIKDCFIILLLKLSEITTYTSGTYLDLDLFNLKKRINAYQ